MNAVSHRKRAAIGRLPRRLGLSALGAVLVAACSGGRERVGQPPQPVVLEPTFLLRLLGPPASSSRAVPAQYPMRPLPPTIRAAHIAHSLEYRMRRVLVEFERREDRLPAPGAAGHFEAARRLLDETENDVIRRISPREFPELDAMRAFVGVAFDRARALLDEEGVSAITPGPRPGGGRATVVTLVRRAVDERPRIQFAASTDGDLWGEYCRCLAAYRPQSALEWGKEAIIALYCADKRNDILPIVKVEIEDAGEGRPGQSLHLEIWPQPAAGRGRPASRKRTRLDRAEFTRVYRGLYAYRLYENRSPLPVCGRPSFSSLDLVEQNGPITCRLSDSCCEAVSPACAARTTA